MPPSMPLDTMMVSAESLVGSVGAMTVVGVIMLLIVAATGLRVVGEHEQVVVTRLGRTSRVRGPGLMFLLPFVERGTTVSLRPVELKLGVTTSTLDGTSVHLQTSALYRVKDPILSLNATPELRTATARVVESRLARQVAQTNVTALLRSRAQFELDLPIETTAIAASWGVHVMEIEVNDIETRLTSNLLRSLRREPSAGAEPV